jgi:hypothetical protein
VTEHQDTNDLSNLASDFSGDCELDRSQSVRGWKVFLRADFGREKNATK